MHFLDDKTDEEEYEFISKHILFDSVMNMPLIIQKGNYGAIYADDNSFQGSYRYTFQEDLNTDGHVISSGEMVYEGSYFPK